MKLFSLGGVRVKADPLLLAVIPAAFVFGRGEQALIAFLSLMVHESAHALFARRLGISVQELKAEPFGFVARMETAGCDPADLAAVYAAGPVASLAVSAFAALASGLIPSFYAASALIEFNLLIAVVNLLPALPLDGGRLLLCAFSGRSYKTAHKVLRASGAILGAAFIALFAVLAANGVINPTFAVMGVFLTLSALTERMPPVALELESRRLQPFSTLPVRINALEEHTTLTKALRLMPAGGYRVVTVVDRSMRRVGELDERAVIEATKALGPSAPLYEAVAFFGQKVL